MPSLRRRLRESAGEVSDVAKGLILASEKGRTGDSYILSGERITVRDLLSMIEEVTGARAPSLKVPPALARIIAGLSPLYYRVRGTKPLFTAYSIHVLTSDCLTTCEKARRELGYCHRPPRESVRDAIQWFMDHGRL